MNWHLAIEDIKKGNRVGLAEWPEGQSVYYDENEDGKPDIVPTARIEEQQRAYERFKNLLYFETADEKRKHFWPTQEDSLKDTWEIR